MSDLPTDPDDNAANENSSYPADKKKQRIERERAELIRSVAAEDFTTLKSRVAAILNLYPNARDSDIVLTIKYWSTFQSDLYNSTGIAPADLFKLERETHIVRARAMIQNDYGLFLASETIKGHRRKNEVTIKAEILEQPAERSVLRVYADETGKTGQFVMVASVWILSGFAAFQIAQRLEAWRKNSTFAKREMHFAKLGKSDETALTQYLEVVRANSEFMSFKLIGVERAKTKRSIVEIVFKLHQRMLIQGALHEVNSGRASLPRAIDVTIDEEDSIDAIALAEMRAAVQRELSDSHKDLTVGDVTLSSSRNSALLQLADMVAGAANRRRNHDGERNFKDEFADQIIETLNLVVEEGGDENFDSSAVLPL